MNPSDIASGSRQPAGSQRKRGKVTPHVAVVAAGAGARGAFEAGALSVLVPALAAEGMRPTVFVGTSAGAINASVLAGTANLKPADSAAKLLELWRTITLRDVFRSPLRSAFGTAATYLGQVFGRSHVVSLLDTTPLIDFGRRLFSTYADALRENVESGLVEALGVAATDRSERTTLFTDLAPGRQLPETNEARAIDYRRAEIDYRHVLASSAIPVLFRPIEVDGAYYTDGGVRLNVPLAPAIAFGATHIVAVATHPETYPPEERTQARPRPPDVVDSISGALGALLADRMVEDLHTLDTLNASANGGPAKVIPRLFVGTKSRGELGKLATKIYRERHRGRRVVRELDFRVLHGLIGAHEAGDGDLLSYIFFDQAYVEAAIQLGQEHAHEVVDGGLPWATADWARQGPDGEEQPSPAPDREGQGVG